MKQEEAMSHKEVKIKMEEFDYYVEYHPTQLAYEKKNRKMNSK